MLYRSRYASLASASCAIRAPEVYVTLIGSSLTRSSVRPSHDSTPFVRGFFVQWRSLLYLVYLNRMPPSRLKTRLVRRDPAVENVANVAVHVFLTRSDEVVYVAAEAVVVHVRIEMHAGVVVVGHLDGMTDVDSVEV